MTKYYSVKEIAAALGVTVRTVYSYIDAGKLHCVKIGNLWKITEKDFDEFIKGQESR